MGHVLVVQNGSPAVAGRSSKDYLNTVADQVNLEVLTFFLACNVCFFDDNATVHRARIVHKRFSEHESDLHHILRPPQSPYVNPIENLWNMLEKQKYFVAGFVRKTNPATKCSSSQCKPVKEPSVERMVCFKCR